MTTDFEIEKLIKDSISHVQGGSGFDGPEGLMKRLIKKFPEYKIVDPVGVYRALGRDWSESNSNRPDRRIKKKAQNSKGRRRTLLNLIFFPF